MAHEKADEPRAQEAPARNVGARAKELFKAAGGASLALPERLRLLRTCLTLAEAETVHRGLLADVGLPASP